QCQQCQVVLCTCGGDKAFQGCFHLIMACKGAPEESAGFLHIYGLQLIDHGVSSAQVFDDLAYSVELGLLKFVLDLNLIDCIGEHAEQFCVRAMFHYVDCGGRNLRAHRLGQRVDHYPAQSDIEFDINVMRIARLRC